MKKNFALSSILAATLMACASLAMATQPTQNPCGNSGNNCQTGGAGGNGGAGGAGGSATGIGVGIGQGGSASATGGSSNATGGTANSNNLNANNNTNRNENRNTNTQGQGQAQGQMQGQAQGQVAKGGNARQGQAQSTDNANNAALTVSVAGDVSHYAAQERNPVATAYAPSISPTAVCALSMSGGAQGSAFGFSIGGSYIDKNCELLEQVRRANDIGQKEVAAEMMMDVPAFAAAAKRIADRKAPKAAAPAGTTPVASVAAAQKAEYTDPIIRSRLGLPPLK